MTEITNEEREEVEAIKKEALIIAGEDIQAAIYALEDGEYLKIAGLENQILIEVAHTELKQALSEGRREKNEQL